jgi:hypothetical protein
MARSLGRYVVSCALVAALAACVVSRQMLASPSDLEDYRAFRTAAHKGRRLAAAQRYLVRHPEGVWVEEVRTIFEAEESAWFEAAQSSRARAREYVVDLPEGPHAAAARALLVLFDEHQDDFDTLVLLADARRTAAGLDYETERRKRVTDVLLQKLSALLDPATWGAALDAPPPALAAALRGEVPLTWGAAASAARRDDTLGFVLPTLKGAEARVLTVSLELELRGPSVPKGPGAAAAGRMPDGGRAGAVRVVQGRLEGEDLFVLWSEAILTRVLDATAASDRELARTTMADLLAGAFEARLPAARCAAKPKEGEVLVRACDGWSVSVRMGAEQGEIDVIDVVGPQAPVPR